MAVTYLADGDAFAADKMDELFADFDRRLSLLHNNKSFLLNFDEDDPFIRRLIGKPFLFANGPVAYATVIPNFHVPFNGAYTGPFYDHSIFEDAVESAVVNAMDATTRIARINRIASSFYTAVGASEDSFVSLFDYSLEAHTIQYQETPESDPIECYISERRGVNEYLIPERHYTFAQAELIYEGTGFESVTFPANYDKYNFFRIHNLNSYSMTFEFENVNGLTITIPPFGMKCVRRATALTGYVVGYTHFHKVLARDPRFYWCWPLQLRIPPLSDTAVAINPIADTENPPPVDEDWYVDQPFPSNGMIGNNVVNPSVIWDWLDALRPLPQEGSARRAYLLRDPHEVFDVSELPGLLFGDPENTSMKLADLIYHRGTLQVIRVLKSSPFTATYDTVEFRGFDTIVADFAAKQIGVDIAEDGTVTLTNLNSATKLYLATTSTNLLKTGETTPSVISFWNPFEGVDKAVTLETKAFDVNQRSFEALVDAVPGLLTDWRNVTTENKQTGSRFLDTDGDGEVDTEEPFEVVGDPIVTLTPVDPPDTRPTKRPANTTVAQLLALSIFGDPDIPASNLVVQRSNVRLVFTPHGLKLLWTETVEATALPVNFDRFVSSLSGDFDFESTDWTFDGERWTAKRAIQFRGHGWGREPRHTSQFYSPRANRFYSRDIGILKETPQRNGADAVFKARNFTESDISVLGRIHPEKLVISSTAGRFWTAGDEDAFHLTTQFLGVNNQHIWATLAGELTGPPGSSGIPTPVPMVAEHYNALAAAVNSCKRGYILDYRSARFVVNGKVEGIYRVYNTPAEFDRFAMWNPLATNQTETQRKALYNQLSIPIQTGGGVEGGDEWVRIDDVKSFVESIGFRFVFNELIRPLGADFKITTGTPVWKQVSALTDAELYGPRWNVQNLVEITTAEDQAAYYFHSANSEGVSVTGGVYLSSEGYWILPSSFEELPVWQSASGGRTFLSASGTQKTISVAHGANASALFNWRWNIESLE